MRNSSIFLAFAFPKHDDQMMISSGRVEGGVEKTIFLLHVVAMFGLGGVAHLSPLKVYTTMCWGCFRKRTCSASRAPPRIWFQLTLDGGKCFNKT